MLPHDKLLENSMLKINIPERLSNGQSTNTVLLVEPIGFCFNKDAVQDNKYMTQSSEDDARF